MNGTANWNLFNLEGVVPQDVAMNSGNYVLCTDPLAGTKDEIIVLIQLGRKVYGAHVGHVSIGYDERDNKPCKMIRDIPGFPPIMIRYDMEELVVKSYNGIKITMACLADKALDYGRANWLY